MSAELAHSLGAIMRAIKLFERDLTHNNVVSGLQGDSSLNMGSLAIYTQGTPLLITQVLQRLSEICRISMGNIMYIWTFLWTSFHVTGKK